MSGVDHRVEPNITAHVNSRIEPSVFVRDS
jgi:hypothetical protein